MGHQFCPPLLGWLRGNRPPRLTIMPRVYLVALKQEREYLGPSPVITLAIGDCNWQTARPISSPWGQAAVPGTVSVWVTQMQSLHPQSAWITHWTLQHACKVIRPGRSFLHRAIELLSIAKWPHHHIRLNHGFESDLMWWKVFSTYRNGASLLVDPNATPQVVLISDALGSWGCGTWCRPRWFQLQWDNSSGLKRITEKELFPVLSQ